MSLPSPYGIYASDKTNDIRTTTRNVRIFIWYYGYLHKGSRKKNSFLSGPPTKRGGGGNGFATKVKRTFFFIYLYISAQ